MGGARPWPGWTRAYRVSFRGAEFRLRLYSLEEYLDVLGGSTEALVEAGEEMGIDGSPYVGALAVDFSEDLPNEAAAEMFSTEIAEEIVGFGRGDYYHTTPANDQEWGVTEDNAYLVVRWRMPHAA